MSIPGLPPDTAALAAALAYAKAGWYVLPVRRGTKDPGSVVGKGWQHQSSREPQMIAAWFAGTDHGIALHCGRSGAVVLDVDRPELVPADWGPHLAAAPYQSSRPDTPGRGHHVFAMPAGRCIGNPAREWGEVRGLNGVIIVAPTEHPDGGEYRWQRTGPVPVLPDELAAQLPDASPAADAVTDAQVLAFVAAHSAATRPGLINGWRKTLAEQFTTGSRHNAAVSVTAGALKEAAAGYLNAQTVLDTLGPMFVAAATRAPTGGEKQRTEPEARIEYASVVAWAVGQALGADPAETRARVDDKMPDNLEWMSRIASPNGQADSAAPAAAAPAADRQGDDAEFWDSRESLRRIRDTALACLVSPWGLLGVCLVYALDTLPYQVHLPGIGDDDSPGSLSLFVALASSSGANKGRTVKVARGLMGRTALDLSPGSGEGLIKCFVRKGGKDDDGGDPFELGGDKFKWVAHTVVFNVPEVDTLVALGQRSSATLPSLLRQAFSGEQLGFGYADDLKRLYVPADQYRFGMVVGVQPGNAGPLFAEESGGTPQRFAWLPTTDARIRRDNRPDKPDPLVLTGYLCWRSSSVFELCDLARGDIEDAAVARARGEGDALDGHALFVRAKIAAALAVLANQVAVSDEDWRLAGGVMAMSDRTRSSVQAALGVATADAAMASGKVAGLKASVAADVQHDRDLERVVGVLVRAAGRCGPMTPRDLRKRSAGRDRPIASAAYDLAVERGLLIESDGLVSASSC